MRPGRIFLFLLAVTLVLLVPSVPGFDHLFRGVTPVVHAGTDSLPAVTEVNDTVQSSTVYKDTEQSAATGIDALADSASQPAVTSNGSSSDEIINSPAELIIDSLSAGKQVRVIYYGDSQLEGDRITSLLRRELRAGGGGSGPGLISPVMPVMYTMSFSVRSSTEWRRYTLLDHRNGILPGNSLGPMLSVCRFTPPGVTATAPVSATVRISATEGADTSVARYEKLRIFYGNNPDTTFAGVSSGGRQLAFVMLERGNGPFEYTLDLPSLSDVTVTFTGDLSPDIYAFSLESDTGVIVDNIPVRGSAGLEFVMTDEENYAEFMKMLSPDLIVLQYGLNVVRNVRSEYHYYEDGLVRQVEFLRRVSGGVPVVLISVTDMADRKGDSISPFINIPAIRDAQRDAALRGGALFWDAWDNMGGQGSIVRWFNSDPPLASKDLAHLSAAGSDTLASRIYRALFVPPVQTEEELPQATDTVVTVNADTTAIRETGAGEGNGFLRKMMSAVTSVIRYNPQQTFIFTTTGFWIFFLVVMAGFALMRHRSGLCHTWLLAVSLYFYYRAGGLFIILLAVTALLTYYTAIASERSVRKGMKKFWLIMNIVVLLGFLSWFKYTGFFIGAFNTLFHTTLVPYDFFSALSNNLFGTKFDVSSIILPVGISFFTFQALSYTVDVYRGRMEPVRNLRDFTFYLTYFPQLVAGPIVRASEFIPQMREEYTISMNEFGHGLFLILQGLIKKMLISDFISTGFVDRVFESPGIYSGFENLAAVYGYGLQIYCDFSGYTDIAIGVAMLMGFRLPLNFNSPYKATNITDFWKRWHITLSRWLRDYLYIPLGGNRKGTFRTGINLMITMLLGGLWHGAAARFVIWGGMHGAGLVVNKIWRQFFRNSRSTLAARAAGFFITFNFVSFTWIFFRAGSLSDAGMMLSQIFSSFSPGDYGTVVSGYLPVVILIVAGYIFHFLPVSVKESYRGLFIRLPLVFKFAVVVGVAVLLYTVGTTVVQPFIYFRF